jgi:hypothetical protein
MNTYKKPHQIVTADDVPTLTPELGARAVRDLISENGWCQNSYRTTDGSFCLKGAIRYVYAFSTNFDDRQNLLDRLENLLQKRGVTDDCAEWNDAAGRTRKQVVDLLRSVERGYGK